MPEPENPDSIRRRRLLFRAMHRGTHENDLLIGGYVSARVDRMTETEMDALEAVMDLPETDLADWLTGRCPIPDGPGAETLHAIRDAALAAKP